MRLHFGLDMAAIPFLAERQLSDQRSAGIRTLNCQPIGTGTRNAGLLALSGEPRRITASAKRRSPSASRSATLVPPSLLCRSGRLVICRGRHRSHGRLVGPGGSLMLRGAA